MKKIVITLFLLLSFELFGQDTLIFERDYIPWPDTTLVFTPTHIKSKIPMLILLHGWSGNYTQWSHEINLHEYSNRYGWIIVTPGGFYDSWYVNSPRKKNSQFETFFWQDLIPELFKKYPIDSSKIFISGLSMGGHGAMTLFLKNPNFFLSAGSTSGILDLTYFPNRWSMKNALGGIEKYPEAWKNNSAIYLLKNIAGTNKQIIFDCGTEGFAYEVNRRFFEKCRELKIKATFISQPGKHTHSYWRKSIKEHFFFFDQLLKETERKKKN